ncbi:MAG: PIG-L deacetylase family protein [Chitinophagaceae bacterium]
MQDSDKILVLAPHTDDGELGAGATIAKYLAEGRVVHYAAFSLCRKSLPDGLPGDTLEKECREATHILGIPSDQLHFFDFHVREFDIQRQAILEDLVKLNKTLNPELIFIPSASDKHQDHQVIHTEALRAFKQATVLGYELPWNHESFRSTYFIKLSAGEIEKKIAAINAYKSQAHRNYMQEDFIRSLARVRGVQCGAEYAEAFEVYKMID